jgi:hypothetical protein
MGGNISLLTFSRITPKYQMTNLRIIPVLFFALAGSVSVFADDEAFNFFVEACRHSGYNPAEIVTFQAELEVKTQMVYPNSAIEFFAKHAADSVEAALKKAGKSEEEIRKAKEKESESARKELSGETNSKLIRIFIKNSASSVGLEDSRPQILEVDVTDNDAYKTSFLFSSVLGTTSDAERKPSMRQFNRSTTINTTSVGDAWYYTGGRIAPLGGVFEALHLLLSRDKNGSFSISDGGIIAFKKFCESNQRTFTLSRERVKYEGDHSAYTLQVYEKGRLREQFLIDPDRGYICPKAQRFNRKGGKAGEEIISESFILDEHSQKWFPEKTVVTLWEGATEDEEFRTIKAFRVIPGTLTLNQPIPDSVFSLTVREGTRVDDARRDDNDKVTFFANQTGKLDLPTIEKQSLDDVEWLTPREVAQYEPPFEIEKASFSWMQIVLMSVGVIMIIWGLILMFRKRYK